MIGWYRGKNFRTICICKKKKKTITTQNCFARKKGNPYYKKTKLFARKNGNHYYKKKLFCKKNTLLKTQHFLQEKCKPSLQKKTPREKYSAENRNKQKKLPSLCYLSDKNIESEEEKIVFFI
jgi:hypothetical protein